MRVSNESARATTDEATDRGGTRPPLAGGDGLVRIQLPRRPMPCRDHRGFEDRLRPGEAVSNARGASTVIRHAGESAPLAIGLLPIAVIEPAVLALLVSTVRRAPLRAPRLEPTPFGAVALSAVAALADPERRTAPHGPAMPLVEKELPDRCHPASKAGLDRPDRSWQALSAAWRSLTGPTHEPPAAPTVGGFLLRLCRARYPIAPSPPPSAGRPDDAEDYPTGVHSETTFPGDRLQRARAFDSSVIAAFHRGVWLSSWTVGCTTVRGSAVH